MRLIVGIKIVFDVDELKKRFLENPVQRIKDCFDVDVYVEKKK